MIKIIETNISLKECGDYNLSDMQSRVIEVGSWEQYLNEIEGRTPRVSRGCILGIMTGKSKAFTSESHYIRKTSYNFIIKHKDSIQIAYVVPER